LLLTGALYYAVARGPGGSRPSADGETSDRENHAIVAAADTDR